MNKEIWKPVTGYESLYEISNLGRIHNIKMNKITYGTYLDTGHKIIILIKDKKKVFKTVSHLVAEYFIPNPYERKFIKHLNDKKYDNRVNNLAWCTFKEVCFRIKS